MFISKNMAHFKRSSVLITPFPQKNPRPGRILISTTFENVKEMGERRTQ